MTSRRDHFDRNPFHSGFGRSFGCVLGAAAGLGVLALLGAVAVGGCMGVGMVNRERTPATTPGDEKLATGRPEPKAVGMGEWSRSGPFRVKVDHVTVDRPTFVFAGGERQADAPKLLVSVEVENVSKSSDVEYRRWTSARGGLAKCRDDAGNALRPHTFAETIKGGLPTSTRNTSPGGTVRDVLVFDPPRDGAKELTLVLEDETAAYAFRIPASAWK